MRHNYLKGRGGYRINAGLAATVFFTGCCSAGWSNFHVSS
jgi:hypothetical protein